MIELISIAIALLTIAFGAFGFLAPAYTASALNFKTDGSTMGYSELRAGSGGLFVAMGIWCLIGGYLGGLEGASTAYAALGVAYLGAGAGRALSILLDKPPLKKALVFLAFEWPPAAFLLWAHGAAIWG